MAWNSNVLGLVVLFLETINKASGSSYIADLGLFLTQVPPFNPLSFKELSLFPRKLLFFWKACPWRADHLINYKLHLNSLCMYDFTMLPILAKLWKFTFKRETILDRLYHPVYSLDFSEKLECQAPWQR